MRRVCSLALLGLLLLGGQEEVRAQAVAPPAALNEINAEYQYVWDRLRPTLQAKLIQDGRAQLAALNHRQGVLDVSIKGVQAVRADLQAGPGFRRVASDGLELALPNQGDWMLEVEAEVRIKLHLGFLRPTFDIPIRLRVEGLGVKVSAVIDDSDPARPVLRRVNRPDLRFRIKLRSPRWYYNVLFWLLNPIGERLARRAVNDALNQLMPQLQNIQGMPGQIPGAGTPMLQDSGAATPFRDIVRGVDQKLRAIHLPHGTLLEPVMDTPALTSWEQAFVTGGPGVQGNVVAYPDAGDSAIWTGHYLASQALRYHVTGEAAAMDNVRHAVGGFGNLLDVNGSTGLLARVAAPESSLMGQDILQRNGGRWRTTLNGVPWAWRQGGNGISRDQYSGAFMGLYLAWDLVPDPAIRAESARRLQQMLDYIISKRWFVDEDRRPFDGTATGGFPTFWAGVANQRITWLLMGTRIVPGRYDAELQRAGPLAATNWLGAWISTFNLDSYYKFNLSHSTYYNYFRVETDPGRLQDMLRSVRILIRYVGHHHNAHFDLVHAKADPALRPTKHSGVREAVRQFVQRKHRHVAPAVINLSNVQYVTYTLPSITLPGQTPRPTQRTLPSQPIPILYQKPEANFLWQRDPFSPARPSQGDPRKETPGIDLVLPYWMGRHEGAF